jgi:phospholipid transport system substrate-binding protein
MKTQGTGIIFGAVLAALLVSGFVMPAAAATSPLEEVRSTMDGIIEVLKQDVPSEDKKAKISSMIKESFDLRAMSQGILATNWKKASKEERRRFQELFTELIETTYQEQVDTYNNEEVRYLSERIKGRKAEVETIVVTANAEIPVQYKLLNKGDGWLAYDIRVEGVSLIRTYRDSYREIVKKEGIVGLLARMERKIEELRNNPPEIEKQ